MKRVRPGWLIWVCAMAVVAGRALAAEPPAKDRPALWAVYYAWYETASGPPWTRGEVVQAALVRALKERGAAGEEP